MCREQTLLSAQLGRPSALFLRNCSVSFFYLCQFQFSATRVPCLEQHVTRWAQCLCILALGKRCPLHIYYLACSGRLARARPARVRAEASGHRLDVPSQVQFPSILGMDEPGKNYSDGPHFMSFSSWAHQV